MSRLRPKQLTDTSSGKVVDAVMTLSPVFIRRLY